MRKFCETCRYWVPIKRVGSDDYADAEFGSCHRRAPFPQLYRYQIPAEYADRGLMNEDYDIQWPITTLDDWCGDREDAA